MSILRVGRVLSSVYLLYDFGGFLLLIRVSIVQQREKVIHKPIIIYCRSIWLIGLQWAEYFLYFLSFRAVGHVEKEIVESGLIAASRAHDVSHTHAGGGGRTTFVP